jgi:uncharacterized protein (TIGR02266 family)
MADDRRREPRQPAEHLKARVRFQDRRQFERCYLKDISRGGIFLRTLKPHPLDSSIEVALELPGGREVKLNGVVVHCLLPDEARPGQQPGMGVQFNDLDARMRTLLEGLLEELSAPRVAVPAPAARPPSPTVVESAAPTQISESLFADFEERRTDPRGQRQTASQALIPDAPIIEEEFESRPTPPLPGTEKPRPPTPHGLRAVAQGGPAKVTVETLRRLLWSFADVTRLEGRSYYEIIGVTPTANPIEVLAACEALRRAFDLDHPPAALGRDLVERVAAVVACFAEIERTLSDSRRRAEYDRSLQAKTNR